VMKNKILSQALGLGLTAGLILTLGAAILPAATAGAQGIQEWDTVNTPSWQDNVIAPGTDIYDYAVGGEDGNIIYAVGEVNTARDDESNVLGLTGCFYADDGELTLSKMSDDVASVSGSFVGDACYLRGDFTAVISVTTPCGTGTAALTGTITYGAPTGMSSDTATFSGFLYGVDVDGCEGTFDGLSGTICVCNWEVGYLDLGPVQINGGNFYEPRVWKSEDGGVSWDDITAKVQAASNLPGPFIQFMFGGVGVAPDDEDWLVIGGTIFHPDFIGLSFGAAPGIPEVVASKDGGDNFSYTGDMIDSTNATMMAVIYDLAVSPEVDDIHNIAVAGMNNEISTSRGTVFRLKAGTWLSAAWQDTSYDAGWDSGVASDTDGVVAVAISPNFDIDDTVVCLGVADSVANGVPYLQSGIWETGETWNDTAGFSKAVEIKSDGDTLLSGVYLRSLGLALPADYDGSDSGARVVFLYANAYNVVTELVGGYLFRVDNASLSTQVAPPGDPLLASIAVSGDADTGKMMIGEYIGWDDDDTPPSYGSFVPFDCCAGVRVWHTEELDICCPVWDDCCKCPSGPYLALVAYTPDGDKAYASTSGALDPEYFAPFGSVEGGLSDESAFSVSRDDGVSWNQIGLIDTDIDYLSDVAVCPDCGTIYLSTINQLDCGCYMDEILEGFCCVGLIAIFDGLCEGCCEDTVCEVCSCDSVWRSYDNGETWERVFHGDWTEWPPVFSPEQLLLRLPCDAVEDCCDQDPVSPSGTVYLAIQNTDQIFYSRDCGQCWNEPPATKITIQDVAVESENIVYVIDRDGNFSMSTQYGRRWSDAVDTEIGSGHTITSCCIEGFVVAAGFGDEPVAYSDDGGETWNLTADLPGSSGYTAHIACDPICKGTIYAALSGPPGVCGGIYRWVIGESIDWENMDAYKYGYYGIAVGRSDGTLYAVSDNIHVDPHADICDRFVAPDTEVDDLTDGVDEHYIEVYSGVARNLTPCDTACCGTEDWDYLICGLGICCEIDTTEFECFPLEWFDREPSALRICGCTSVATHSILWAIDTQHYDVTDGMGDNDCAGSLWAYEDCAAKLGPTLLSPRDGAVLNCEPCAGCDAASFTLEWERICNACSWDIEIMDEDGNLIVGWDDVDVTCEPPELFVDGTMDDTSYYLECGNTYTWHVRMADTECECVHSPWSETWSFTVAVGAADAIKLLAPEEGALDVPIQPVGFSWTGVLDATTYSFVLSPNANLTGALVSQNMSTTAFNYVGPLEYNKAYYWQITAWKDSIPLTTSSIGVFQTMAEPAPPTPPVVVEPTPAPVVQIPPTQQIVPTWIYVLIGIGAALVIVVIVLIVRTRRP
jgi:hypothetical protein